ncbi:MAG: UDP-4-amino-4,6-dideoxy-N-acetyl-beta-L-altrosamine transaminase [Thermodesulfobacteriota bacterium]
MGDRDMPYGGPVIDADDTEAVLDVLKGGRIAEGPTSAAFERALCQYTGAAYAVVCSSGTAALHLACLAAGLGPGDNVITTPLTTPSTANAALYVGASVTFADVDPETGNIDPEKVEEAARADGGARAVIPVHYGGRPAEVERIRGLARDLGLVVIEDAREALGADRLDDGGLWTKVGSCAHSDMTVFSFHPTRVITSGEGGAVTTNDRGLYELLKAYRDHGVTREPAAFVNRRPAPWYYEMQRLGFNYRLSDIHAALGISQMKRLDRFIERRREIAALYDGLFGGYPLVSTPPESPRTRGAWLFYPVTIDFDGLGVSRAGLFGRLGEAGVSLDVHHIPVHTQPYYAEGPGAGRPDLPSAERFFASEVSLPIHPGLADTDVKAIADALTSEMTHTLAAVPGAPAKVIDFPSVQPLKAARSETKEETDDAKVGM